MPVTVYTLTCCKMRTLQKDRCEEATLTRSILVTVHTFDARQEDQASKAMTVPRSRPIQVTADTFDTPTPKSDGSYRDRTLSASNPSATHANALRPLCRRFMDTKATITAWARGPQPEQRAPFPLGLHVYKQYLHWAPKSRNMTYIGLFGASGFCRAFQKRIEAYPGPAEG